MSKNKQRNRVSDTCHQLSFDPVAGSGKFEAGAVRTIREADLNAPTMSRKNSPQKLADTFRKSFGNCIGPDDTLAEETARVVQGADINAPTMPQTNSSLPISYERSGDSVIFYGDDEQTRKLRADDLAILHERMAAEIKGQNFERKMKWAYRFACFLAGILVAVYTNNLLVGTAVARTGWLKSGMSAVLERVGKLK